MDEADDDTPETREEFIDSIIDAEFEDIDSLDVRFLEAEIDKGVALEAAVDARIAVNFVTEEQKPELLEAWARFCQLNKLNDRKLQKLQADAWAEVERKEAQKERAERERLLRKEQEALDAPEMIPDFEHFRAEAFWTTHEALCLLLNKDPRHCSGKFVASLPKDSRFAAKYRALAKHLSRATEINLIGDENQIDPGRLVDWARKAGIQVPEPLLAAFPEYKENCASSANIAELENEISRLKSALQSERASHTQSYEKTLVILGALLHGNFKGDPNPQRATVRAVNDFVYQALHFEIDPGTIRARLKDLDKLSLEIESEIDMAIKKERKRKLRNRQKNP